MKKQVAHLRLALILVALAGTGLLVRSTLGRTGASMNAGNDRPQSTGDEDLWLIVPGKQIGKLQLGDAPQHFWQLFVRYEPGSDEYTYPCGGIQITELEHIEAVFNPISAYAKHGHIFEISASGSLSRTADGITEFSSPQRVKRLYPGLEAYWLEHHRQVLAQSRDSIFWVDEKHGIAFQLDYFTDDHRRLVSEIYVFNAGEKFQPEGCVQFPQVFKKIAPYSLEPPGQDRHSASRKSHGAL